MVSVLIQIPFVLLDIVESAWRVHCPSRSKDAIQVVVLGIVLDGVSHPVGLEFLLEDELLGGSDFGTASHGGDSVSEMLELVRLQTHTWDHHKR